MVIQAVCDKRMLYRDVYVGETGSVGDLRTFQRSPLASNLFLRRGLLSEGEHLLGDGAYPLSPQVNISAVSFSFYIFFGLYERILQNGNLSGKAGNHDKAREFRLPGKDKELCKYVLNIR